MQSRFTKKAQEAITPHNETKRTEKALKKEAEIEWAGTLASVKVGFSISEGGLASIFLMYGTQSHSVSNQYGKNNGDNASKPFLLLILFFSS